MSQSKRKKTTQRRMNEGEANTKPNLHYIKEIYDDECDYTEKIRLVALDWMTDGWNEGREERY